MSLLRIFGFVFRFSVAVVMASGALTFAASDSAVPIDLSRTDNISTQNFRVIQDVPAKWTLAQVLAEPPSRFAELDTKRSYPVSLNRALWLHFQITSRSPQPRNTIVFEVQEPYVDEVQFHYQNDQGQWSMQSAGKLVALERWPLRGLYPRFELPAASSDVRDIYVKVLRVVPIRVDVGLKSLNESNFGMQQQLFVYGLVIGLLALMSIFGLVLAAAYRQPIYMLFSLYASLACIVGANYLGLTNYTDWATSSSWPVSSVMLGTVVIALVKTQFCYVIFSQELSARWLKNMVSASLAISIMCIVGLVTLPYGDIDKRPLFFMALATSTATMLSIIGLAIYKRSAVGWIWLLAFLPVTTLLLLTAIDVAGLVVLPVLPHDTLVYARTFEVIVLLFALQIHVKLLHGRQVRTRTLEELDPLTGFLAALQFPDTLASMWSQARSNREDLAVAYISATVELDAYQTANQPSDDEMVLRCVRMLRMVTRQDDTVARIGKNTFAILMPGVSTGPNFADKLARLIALGGMHDTDDASHIPVKFQIAATTFRCFKSTSGQLNDALWKKLNMMAMKNRRAIEFISN